MKTEKLIQIKEEDWSGSCYRIKNHPKKDNVVIVSAYQRQGMNRFLDWIGGQYDADEEDNPCGEVYRSAATDDLRTVNVYSAVYIPITEERQAEMDREHEEFVKKCEAKRQAKEAEYKARKAAEAAKEAARKEELVKKIKKYAENHTIEEVSEEFYPYSLHCVNALGFSPQDVIDIAQSV